MNYKLIAITFFLFLVSCTQEINLPSNLQFEKGENVKMSDVVSDYSLIKLETNDENLILDASMVEIVDECIYVLDCFSQNKTIHVFELSGKYVGKIGSVGQGPGEYIMPQLMCVDSARKEIFVKDVAQNKLLVYDAIHYHFLEEIVIPFYSDCFSLLNSDKLIWYVGTGCANKGNYSSFGFRLTP